MEMGGLVEQQLADAVRSLSEKDSALAEKVISDDYKVNAMEVGIDEECTHVLARRQPAATDLRLVMAVIKTITDLERIGDEAERIGRMSMELVHGSDSLRSVYLEIEHLGNHVRGMLRDALDCFARMDPELAVRVAKEDLKVDLEYESVLRHLITYMMEEPRTIPRVLHAIWACRALERIGDRARNICEYVIYLVKGRDVRHTSLEQMEAQAAE
jgi:phosphate transport system protein